MDDKLDREAGPCETQLEQAELGTLLDAWHGATDRLQKTHETLCHEVRKLSGELAAKNRELARKNRLADLGQIASHVAHEVRNGLVPLTLYLSLLRRHVADPAARRVVNRLEAGFTSLEATVSDLLQFTSQHDPKRSRFELGRLIDEVCQSVAPQLSAQEIEVEFDLQNISIDADRDMFRRAVLNLLLNAIDAMPHGGDLFIGAWQTADDVELEVSDSGPGVHVEASERIFEPFFSTKSGGTGLGLAIVSKIAEVHGGQVFFSRCPQGGAAFTIKIPQRVFEAAA